jgi:hypothetical protein
MKKFFAPFFAILLISFLISFQGCKKDESTPVTPSTSSSSIGQFVLTPNGIVAGTSTQITVRLTVPANIKLSDSTVKLIKVDSDNKPLSDVGFLYDNGKLANGDEIIGDNIYSAIVTISEPSAGTVKYCITAKIKSGGNGATDPVNLPVYANLSSTEFNNVINTQTQSVTKLNEFLAGNPANLESATNQLLTWVQGQSAVQSAEKSGSTSITIKYKSGVEGGLIISQLNSSGKTTTRGGVTTEDRRKSKQIPLQYQTIGTKKNLPGVLYKTNYVTALDPKVIGNRNVLIYAPFEAAFSVNERPSVESILSTSGFEFGVTSLTNQQATVSALSNLTNYGLVLLATHGSDGKAFATGEVVDTNVSNYATYYKPLLAANKLAIWTNMTISTAGGVTKRSDIYAVRFPFISDLAGTFPNSVIINNSCESMKTLNLANAFTGKGAKTYYGYDKVVHDGLCLTVADTVVKRLSKDLKNTGEAFISAGDPFSPNAVSMVNGANDVHFTDSLINGDFEYGKLDGWTKSGDGRVISQLASVGPTQPNYMGIISTGLGFTTATGKIFQSFKVENNQSTLRVKWNFLSEEFLTFIGSSFQDYFKIKIKVQDGSEVTLFSKTIDGIAAQFGASYNGSTNPPTEIPGNLIKVSPTIVFDRGDVYMTSWQTANYDITPYRGKIVTLILEAGDVGDSIYDTAILLDEISVQ